MTSYETTLIFDPQLQEEGWDKAVEEYAAIVGRGGEIKLTDRWGLRRLAYPINRRAQGYYVHFIHESPPEIPREIERHCRLDENCLRYLTVVSDNPKYVEELQKREAARASASTTTAATTPSTGDTAVAKPAKTEKTEESAKPADTAAPDAASAAPVEKSVETAPAGDTPEPPAKEETKE